MLGQFMPTDTISISYFVHILTLCIEIENGTENVRICLQACVRFLIGYLLVVCFGGTTDREQKSYVSSHAASIKQKHRDEINITAHAPLLNWRPFKRLLPANKLLVRGPSVTRNE